VALNIADLAEHAIDAVPDRVALISADGQLTYAQLEEKANRFAHYLQDQGVKKDDKVGLYCRNRIEIVIAMLGIVKAGAILVNVNFRYVEGELKYLFENSDMVALVHERRYADRVANVLPETPNVKTILVVEDGSDDDFVTAGSSSTRRWSRVRPSAISASAAPTTSTCSTPAAPQASRRA
jgi:acyl-CoA synthetase (AMP-forming)/AMP-acid ligase II